MLSALGEHGRGNHFETKMFSVRTNERFVYSSRLLRIAIPTTSKASNDNDAVVVVVVVVVASPIGWNEVICV